MIIQLHARLISDLGDIGSLFDPLKCCSRKAELMLLLKSGVPLLWRPLFIFICITYL